MGERLWVDGMDLLQTTVYKAEEFPDLIERLQASGDRRLMTSGLWRLFEDKLIEKWTQMAQTPPITGVRPLDDTDKAFKGRVEIDVAQAFDGADGRIVTYLHGYAAPGLVLPYAVEPDGKKAVVRLTPNRTLYRFILRDDPTSLSKGQKLAAIRSWLYQDTGFLAMTATPDLEQGTLQLTVPDMTQREQYNILSEQGSAKIHKHLDTMFESRRLY